MTIIRDRGGEEREQLTTAVPNATLSAHVPTGYEAFSTLAPWIYSPDWVRMHAPTRNFEYGPSQALAQGHGPHLVYVFGLGLPGRMRSPTVCQTLGRNCLR